MPRQKCRRSIAFGFLTPHRQRFARSPSAGAALSKGRFHADKAADARGPRRSGPYRDCPRALRLISRRCHSAAFRSFLQCSRSLPRQLIQPRGICVFRAHPRPYLREPLPYGATATAGHEPCAPSHPMPTAPKQAFNTKGTKPPTKRHEERSQTAPRQTHRLWIAPRPRRRSHHVKARLTADERECRRPYSRNPTPSVLST
jgi:hypothetical protein